MAKKPPKTAPLSKRRLRQIAKRGKPNQREARALAAMASDLLALRSLPQPAAPVRLFELTLTEDDELLPRAGVRGKMLRLECRQVMASIQRDIPGPRLQIDTCIDDANRMRPDYDKLREHVVGELGAGIGKRVALSLPVTQRFPGISRPMPCLGAAGNPFKESEEVRW
jgi:hypothetical protein